MQTHNALSRPQARLLEDAVNLRRKEFEAGTLACTSATRLNPPLVPFKITPSNVKAALETMNIKQPSGVKHDRKTGRAIKSNAVRIVAAAVHQLYGCLSEEPPQDLVDLVRALKGERPDAAKSNGTLYPPSA